jgi:hypothetical protein
MCCCEEDRVSRIGQVVHVRGGGAAFEILIGAPLETAATLTTTTTAAQPSLYIHADLHVYPDDSGDYACSVKIDDGSPTVFGRAVVQVPTGDYYARPICLQAWAPDLSAGEHTVAVLVNGVALITGHFMMRLEHSA